MSIKVQISGRDCTTAKSKTIQRFAITPSETSEKGNQSDFFLETFLKEVKSLPKNQQTKWKQKLRIAYQTCVSLLVFVKPAAASMTIDTNIIPMDLLHIILQLEFLAVILGVALAQICFVGAGIYRVLRKEKISREWSVDIIKGLVQILIAPIVITTVTYIIYFLFGNSEWFINPLEVFSQLKNSNPIQY